MAENTAVTPYTPLPSNDPSATRLLKLLPAGFHEPVQCELETISLANEPSYVALSYVWGNPTDTVPITLNGIEHGVTENLDSFLRHLQALLREIFLVLQCLSVDDWPSGLQIIEALNSLPTSEQNSENLSQTAQAAVLFYFESIDDETSINEICVETVRPAQITQWNDLSLPRLWIDALCINQSDLAERSEQVKRMDHIYSQTHLLFVWGLNKNSPGISEESSGPVFRYIEWLCGILENSSIDSGSGITEAVRTLFTEEVMINDSTIEAIAWFFRLDWFYRAWAFQEVALSASKPSELWMGFKHISLFRLLVVGNAVLRVSAELQPENVFISVVSKSRADRALLALSLDDCLVDFEQSSLHNVHPTSDLDICRRLVYILSAGHMGSQVTDPRDTIFSLYGLLSTTRLPAIIQPDYTKSVSAVFHAVASFILSHMGIDVLGFLLSSSGGMDGCASWVPDFSSLPYYSSLCQQYPSSSMTYNHRTKDDHLIIEEAGSNDCTAGYNLELSSPFLRISCPIYWLQTIESVVHVDGGWKYPEITDGQSIDDFLLDRNPVMNAVSLGVVNSLHHVTQAYPDNDFSTWARLLEQAAGCELFPYLAPLIGVEAVTDVYKNLFDGVAVDQKLKPRVEGILHGCLGITRDGHLILGTRMNRLEKHDRIGFIPGSQDIFIFRPCGSGYRFITNIWQSDMVEFTDVEGLQLGDRDMITII